MDPHSFFADPDPAVFLNADPDPEGKMNADPFGSGSSFTNFVKKSTREVFSIVVKKYIKDTGNSSVRTNEVMLKIE